MLRSGVIPIIFLLFPFSLMAREPVSSKQSKQFGQHSLCFIENKGQVTDQFSNARNDIQFKVEAGNGLNIFIGNGALHYQWSKQNSKGKKQNLKEDFLQNRPAIYDSDLVTEMYRMDVELIGANKNAEIITEEKKDDYETYYTAPFSVDKGGTVHSYKKITYRNIYPDIDWVFYTKENQLKYDFIVRPGSHVADIKLRYGGATALIQNADRSLTASTPMGSISEQKPYSFEKERGNVVASKFLLQNNILSFNVGDYEGTLIIDPALEWATYYGGSNYDYGQGVVTDLPGNVYLQGVTASNSNIATTGSYQSSYSGSYDIFLAKFNSSGVRQWATYYGGSGDDWGYTIATDGQEHFYICGQTQSTANIATSGAFQTSNNGNIDAFLVKFDSSGAMQWGTYYGGSGDDRGSGVSCDNSGNVYICGYAGSTSGIASSGSNQSSFGGGQYDAFLVKFNSSGSRQWATYYGGSGFDVGNSVGADQSGNVYLTGTTNSTSNISSSSSYQQSLNGADDAFLVKFNSSGVRQWGTYYGGSNDDGATCVVLDNSGNIYICGATNSTANIATSGSFQSSLAGGTEAFLSKFNGSGTIQWATYFGGNNADVANAVASDNFGNVFITGYTNSSANIATSNAYQTSLAGSDDAFITRFNSSGARIWASYYGGSNDEKGYSITASSSKSIYICGNTGSSANIATTGAFQTTYGGGGIDAYLAKFDIDTIVYCNQPFTDTLKCAGDTIHIHYSVSDTFNSGNTFTVQLSNSSGSFTNAVSIGNIAATTGGTVLCTIPANTPLGTAYRVRIISSSPVDTSIDDGVNLHISQFPTVNVSVNSPLCTGDTLLMTGSGTTGVNYSWSGPNGFSYASSSSVSIPNVGSVNAGYYYLTASLNSCSVHDTFNVVINQKPAVPVASANTPLCSGQTLNLSATCITSGVSYQWTGPSNFSSALQNPVIAAVSLSDSGDYIVNASKNGCTSINYVLVVVNHSPDSIYHYTNSPLCTGDTLHLIAGSSSSGVSYVWTGPGSFYAANSNAIIANAQTANSGNYFLSMSLNSCVIHDTFNVVVNQKPALLTIYANNPVCAGASLNISASSTTPGVSYQWSGPNNFSSNVQNPSINNMQAINAGIYTVNAVLGNCSSPATVNIAVNPSPAQSITTNGNPLCVGDSLQVSTNNNVPGGSYSWSGPNSFSTSNKNFTIYNVHSVNAGYYYLNATLNSCTVLDTLHIVINPKPSVPVISTNSPVCANDTLRLNASDSLSGVSYQWLGPNSYSSTIQNSFIAHVIANNAGTYTVIAALANCSSSTATYVTINPLPAQVNISSNSPVCAGDSLHINVGNSTAGATYSWSGPSYISASQNIGIANAGSPNAGYYYLAITLNGCSIHDTVNAVVKPLPVTPSITSNSPICVGENLQFTIGNLQSGVFYSWAGPAFNSLISNPIINNVQLNNAGNYIVTATLNGCIAKDSVQLTVNAKPASPSANSNSPICQNDTLYLYANSSSTGVTYNWSGPSYSATSQNPSILNAQLSSSGTYTVVLSLNGCKDTLSIPVTVNPALGPPVISISVLPGDTVCAGTNLTFNAMVSNAGSPAYTWNRNGAIISGATTASFTTTNMSNGDHITCIVNSTLACQAVDTARSNSLHLDIISMPPPIVSVSNYPLNYTLGTYVTFTGHPPAYPAGLTYAWTKNGVFIPGNTSTTLTSNSINPTDVICFIAYSPVPCTVPDSGIACAGTLSVSSLASAGDSLEIFPNPVNNELSIKGAIQGSTINIYNILGQLVYTGLPENPLKNPGAFSVYMGTFSNGTYILELIAPDGSRQVRKILKQ